MERLFIKVRSFKLDADVNGMNPTALFKYRLQRTANRVLEVNTQWLWPFSSPPASPSESAKPIHMLSLVTYSKSRGESFKLVIRDGRILGKLRTPS